MKIQNTQVYSNTVNLFLAGKITRNSDNNITENSQKGDIPFVGIFSSRKPIQNIFAIVKTENLKNLKAFRQLDDFIKENKLTVIMDSSRKKYKAKPYYLVQIEDVGAFDTIAHGYGNTKEDAICNMIMILNDFKKRGALLTNYNNQASYKIPEFDLFDLFKINVHMRMQFERFKNK